MKVNSEVLVCPLSDREQQLRHLQTAMDCFTSGLTAAEIENLHRAFMYKGRPLKMLMAIAKGRMPQIHADN